MSERIRWEDNEHRWDDGGCMLGYAGTRKDWLFQIFEATDDADDETLALTFSLSGVSAVEIAQGDSTEKLKAEAEKWLEEFASSLGAVFPGGHPEGNAIEAYTATSAGDGDGRHLLQYAVRLPDGTTTAYGDQSWVSAGLGARDHDGASTVVRDIWVSYGPWRTHETTAPGTEGKANQ